MSSRAPLAPDVLLFAYPPWPIKARPSEANESSPPIEPLIYLLQPPPTPPASMLANILVPVLALASTGLAYPAHVVETRTIQKRADLAAPVSQFKDEGYCLASRWLQSRPQTSLC
jgi:hypothetical protein